MGNSPELRVLKLQNFSEHLPSAAEDPQDETDVISLAHLEETTLAGSFRDVTYVLDHFTVPSGDCTIRVEYYGYWENVMPIEMVTPQQGSFRSLLPHCTTIEFDVNIVATVSAFNKHGICFLDLQSPDYLAAVHHPTITQGNWMAILHVFDCAPLSRFSLTYGYPPHITSGMWTALFDRFPLEAIEIKLCKSVEERGRADFLENLFDALCGPASFRITTLEFTFLTLTWATIGAIFDLLEYRDSIEKPLETLVFNLCFCESTKHVEDLKTNLESYVNVVIWYDMDADTPADDFRIYDNQRGSFSSRWSIT